MDEKKPRTLLLIHWVDSTSNGQSGSPWISPEYAHCDVDPIESIGWFVEEGEKAITIAAHWSNHHVSGNMSIPKVAITGRWEITL